MRKDIIEKWARENSLEISGAQFDALAAYQKRVLEINRHMNLTAITNDEDFAVKHIVDSLTLLPLINDGASLIDIGTGAGFPGLVLRIMKNIRLTLLDSLRKRVIFLRETSDMLGFPEAECVHARAEDWSKNHGGMYDICTARAVASLDKLAGYALPLVKTGGLFLAMKGRDVENEIEKSKPALKKFGGVINEIKIAKLAEGLEHSIVVVRKEKIKLQRNDNQQQIDDLKNKC